MDTLNKMTYGHYILTALKEGEELESREDDYISAGVVNWATQVSFEPAMVAVAVEKESDLNETINYSNSFTLHYLGKEQDTLIETFSSKSIIKDDQINGIHYQKKNGEAILPELAGHATFKVEKFENIGDHAVYFGKLIDEEHKHGNPVLHTEDTPMQYNADMK